MIKLRSLLREYVSQADLNAVESYADKLFAAVGVDVEFTRHFLDRVNDRRNRTPIEPEELEDLFRKTYEEYGTEIPDLGDAAEAVITDMQSDINVPFVLRYDSKRRKIDLISKTVMRKPNFRTPNQRLTV